MLTQFSFGDDGSSPLLLKLFVDSNNRIWAGHISGLYLVSLVKDSNETVDLKLEQSVINKHLVRDIVETPEGALLVGSHSGLIKVFEQGRGVFELDFYTKENGLSDNTVYAILPIDSETYWLSSNKGLTLFDLKTDRIINYQDINHIGQLEFNGASKHRLADGRWLFGGVSGVTQIDQVALTSVGQGPIWIYEMRYGENFDNAYYLPNKKLIFTEEQNVFAIRFVNTNFDSSQRPLFRYRLNDEAWVELSERDEIIFAGLDPGKYQLEVESKLGLSEWKSASNSLEFEVVTSFWRSKLAMTFYAVILLSFIVIIGWQEYRRRRQAHGAMERIKTNEERLTMALTASELGLWDWTPENNIISRFNVAHLFKTKDLYANFDKFDEIVHPKDRNALKKERERFFKEKGEFDIQYRVLSDNNRWRWIHDKGKVVEVDDEGQIVRASGTYTDITDLKRAQLESVLSNEVIRSMAEAVVVMDSHRKVAFVNPAFSRMTGYSYESIIHNDLTYLRSAKHGERFYEKFWEEFDEGGSWFGELWIRCDNGKDILCSLEAFHISDEELEEYLSVLIFNNITEKRRAEEELSYLARYDALTGLPNRNLFNDRLEHAIALAKRHEHKLAVMFIDLDGFKKVNDSFGHHAGDALLKRTAEIIRSCIRDEDTLARLSGDEFILIIEDYNEVSQLKVVLSKILSQLQKPMEIVQNKVAVSCSIGVSQYPKDGTDADSLMRYADTAMYHAKERGKNQYFFYREEMHRRLIHRISIENYLRDAVANNELYLVFQPIIDIASEEIVAAEALIRWRNPQLGEVFPVDFIPLAEESGHILEIGKFVFNQVCQKIAYWREKYQLEVKVAVNVSVRQLMDSNFVADLDALIQQENISSDLIKVEVTESMLMANAGKANQIIKELKQLGVTISIDDFGTGYSSLSYLRRFAIDELKIDKEFISDIHDAFREETIVNAIIALAQSLNLKVVAEGVETEEQLRYLAQHGCDYAQGFYFSKPCEATDFELLLQNKRGIKSR